MISVIFCLRLLRLFFRCLPSAFFADHFSPAIVILFSPFFTPLVAPEYARRLVTISVSFVYFIQRSPDRTTLFDARHDCIGSRMPS